MKTSLSTLMASIMLCAALQAQTYNVTFQVDMNTQTSVPDTISVAGSFQEFTSVGAAWQAGATQMTDDNMDGVYEVTVAMTGAPDTIQYKFINGLAWGNNEGISGPCEYPGTGNRYAAITSDTTLTYCYNTCDASCPTIDTVNVTFRVDMSMEPVVNAPITVAGNFLSSVIDSNWSDWTGGQFNLSNTCGGFYEGTVRMLSGTYEFKFQNGIDGWEGFANNRALVVPAGGGDIVLDRALFNNEDSTIVLSTNVTFQADMRRQFVDPSLSDPDTVIVAGSFGSSVVGGTFGDWNDCGYTLLEGTTVDSMFSGTYTITEGSYEYKYLNGCGGWESVANASLDLDGCVTDTVITRCFNRLTEDCGPILAPIDVTFRVDMSEQIVNASGVYVAGTFQNPAWIKYTLGMDDGDANKVYEYTTTVIPDRYAFLFFNGADTANTDIYAEVHNFEMSGCGEPNGIGGYNRVADLSMATGDTILPIWKFESCDLGVGDTSTTSPPTPPTGLDNLDLSTAIYPNPADVVLTIQLVDNGIHQVSLMNAVGQEVRTLTLTDGQGTLDISSIHSGVYTILIENLHTGRRGTRSVIIE